MWKEQKAVAADGVPQAWYGTSMAVSDTVALVGAKNTSVGANASQGAVYVLHNNNGVWTQVQKLVASDGAAGDQFGSTIAFRGSVAIITAPLARVNGRTWQGAAYVFALSGGTWVQRQKLVAASGVALDTLGTAIAFNSSTVFIGAGGANVSGHYIPRKVYTFDISTYRIGAWVEGPVLPPPDPDDATSSFGASIAVTDDFALIGARASTIGANLGQGRVYAYIRNHGVWTPVQKLVASDGAIRDNFGISLAVDGKIAMIGAQGATINGQISAGAVYCWEHSGTEWTQTHKLVAADPAATNLFGASVSLAQDTVLIGAYGANSYRGAAYVFKRVPDIAGNWKQTLKLTASDGASGDVFGYFTALDAKTALVGAYTAKVGANVGQGATYFFARPSPGEPD